MVLSSKEGVFGRAIFADGAIVTVFGKRSVLQLILMGDFNAYPPTL